MVALVNGNYTTSISLDVGLVTVINLFKQYPLSRALNSQRIISCPDTSFFLKTSIFFIGPFADSLIVQAHNPVVLYEVLCANLRKMSCWCSLALTAVCDASIRLSTVHQQ